MLFAQARSGGGGSVLLLGHPIHYLRPSARGFVNWFRGDQLVLLGWARLFGVATIHRLRYEKLLEVSTDPCANQHQKKP